MLSAPRLPASPAPTSLSIATTARVRQPRIGGYRGGAAADGSQPLSRAAKVEYEDTASQIDLIRAVVEARGGHQPFFVDYLSPGGALTLVRCPTWRWRRAAGPRCALSLDLIEDHSIGYVAVNSLTIRTDSLAALSQLGSYQAGPTGGRWEVIAGGSTQSDRTGPGTNSSGPYVATDTSGNTGAAVLEMAGVVDVGVSNWLAGRARSLTLRLAVIGRFGEADNEGLRIEGRASSGDVWSLVALVRGWRYSTDYTVGDRLDVFGGPPRRCIQDGGWSDVAVNVPAAHTQIRLLPDIEGPARIHYRHDIALWSVTLAWAA